MTSVAGRTRQVSPDVGYYIPLASLIGKIYALNPTTGALTTAAWPATKMGSTISTIGGNPLKDMGKTYVSAGRVFRKIQLVVSTQTTVAAGASTFGVGGSAGTSPVEDYYTGYIELGSAFGTDNAGAYTPVAHSGR